MKSGEIQSNKCWDRTITVIIISTINHCSATCWEYTPKPLKHNFNWMQLKTDLNEISFNTCTVVDIKEIVSSTHQCNTTISWKIRTQNSLVLIYSKNWLKTLFHKIPSYIFPELYLMAVVKSRSTVWQCGSAVC